MRERILWCIAAALLVWTLNAQHSNSEQVTPRYVLTAGELTTTGVDGQRIGVHTFLKMDSATGRTWRYDSLIDKSGKLHDGWVPVRDAQ